jgi:hypothetical protein
VSSLTHFLQHYLFGLLPLRYQLRIQMPIRVLHSVCHYESSLHNPYNVDDGLLYVHYRNTARSYYDQSDVDDYRFCFLADFSILSSLSGFTVAFGSVVTVVELPLSGTGVGEAVDVGFTVGAGVAGDVVGLGCFVAAGVGVLVWAAVGSGFVVSGFGDCTACAGAFAAVPGTGVAGG